MRCMNPDLKKRVEDHNIKKIFEAQVAAHNLEQRRIFERSLRAALVAAHDPVDAALELFFGPIQEGESSEVSKTDD